MRGVNKVILVGTLGKDPEVKYSSNGKAIAHLIVATSEQWSDKATGQKQEKTEWHRVVVFGSLAETCQQYLRKGSKVYLEGKMQTRTWQDQGGLNHYTTEVVLSGFDGTMRMLDSRNEDATMEANDSFSETGKISTASKAHASRKKTIKTVSLSAGYDPFDIDVPF